MSVRRALAAAVYTLLAAILVSTVVVAVRGLADGELKPIDLWASLVPVVLTVATVVLTALQSGRGPLSGAEEEAAARAPALARKVAQDWREECRHRGLYPERRMPVRWRRRPGWERASPLSADLPDEGVLDRLTGAFARNAQAGHLSRLMVTGEAGAGKNALCLLLTLELAGREPLVPVLFSLASWEPRRPLTEWMTDELATHYPLLADGSRGRRIAGHLVRHHVLPVLDGLDEVADPSAALRRVDDELVGRSFVLTCRSDTYAGLGAGWLLTDAMVVDLLPLRADEAREVLESAGGPGRGPLLSALAARPDGPVARALATPFMLSLAVALGGSLPADLLAGGAPDTEERVRRHLLGTFVRRAYPQDPDPGRGRFGGFGAEDARRHLAFLARQVDAGTHRLAWWHLHRAVPRAVFLAVAPLSAAIGCSAAAVALFSLFGRPLLGLWIGLGAAVAGALVVELVPQDDPRRAKPRLRSVRPPTSHALQRVLGFGAVGGAACAVIVAFLYDRPQYAVIGGVLSGSTYAAARHFSEPSDPMEAVTPLSLLRSDRAAVRYAWLLGAVAGACTGAYLGASIKAGRRTPQLDDVALIVTLPTWAETLLGAAGGALLSATGLGLMALGSSAWGRFLTARCWLALRGRLPWRLLGFVEDARERGVLRQVNGYYEFRHRMLQRHLAEENAEAPRGAPPAGPGPRPLPAGPGGG